MCLHSSTVKYFSNLSNLEMALYQYIFFSFHSEHDCLSSLNKLWHVFVCSQRIFFFYIVMRISWQTPLAILQNLEKASIQYSMPSDYRVAKLHFQPYPNESTGIYHPHWTHYTHALSMLYTPWRCYFINPHWCYLHKTLQNGKNPFLSKPNPYTC